jgi:hypothetical protein
MVDECGGAAEYAVGDPVVAHILPDVLLWVQLVAGNGTMLMLL